MHKLALGILQVERSKQVLQTMQCVLVGLHALCSFACTAVHLSLSRLTLRASTLQLPLLLLARLEPLGCSLGTMSVVGFCHPWLPLHITAPGQRLDVRAARWPLDTGRAALPANLDVV